MKIFAALSILFLITACLNNTAAGSKTYSLTYKDNNKSLIINIGDVIKITLDSNTTTGFSWNQKSELKILEKSDEKYLADKKGIASGMVGTGGQTVLEYKAVKKGKDTLILQYMQAWDKNTPPAKTFSVNISVN